MKYLIVEDEAALSGTIRTYLQAEGAVVQHAATFDEAFACIGLYHYDCIVLDITLPGGSGLDLVHTIQAQGHQTGILILTARHSMEEKIKGLEMGADDYLTKPFHLAELNARLKAILRRRRQGGKKELLWQALRVFPDEHLAYVNQVQLVLTKLEFDLLAFFIVNAGRVLRRETIAEHVWGDAIDTANSFDFLYTHIKNIRRKIIDAGGQDYIKSVYGVGYQLIAP